MKTTASMLPFLLHEAAITHPDTIAIHTPKSTFTYKEVYFICLGLTSFLKNIQPLEDDYKVFLDLKNSQEYIFLIMALQATEALAVHLNVRFPTEQIQDILTEMVSSSETTLLITDNKKRLELALPKIKVLLKKDIPWKKIVQQAVRSAKKQQPDTHKLETFSGLPEALQAKKKVNIIFTSASTTSPKGVVHSYGNHYYSAMGSNQNIPLHEGDIWFIALPLFHVGGLSILYRAFMAKATIFISEKPLVDTLKKYIFRKEKMTTHISLVPAQIYQIIQNTKLCRKLASLKAILTGGSNLPPFLFEYAREFRWNFYATYGSSEMSSQICTTPPPHSQRNRYLPNTGNLLPFRELKLASDGEILVQGATLFQGYYQNGACELSIDSEGWFHTNDLGRLDSQGYLYITGRKDNMFISGGENIQPEEIENIILTFREIQEAVVVPVADERFGHIPAAFLTFSDQRLGPYQKKKCIQSLRTGLAHKMPRFKLPVCFLELPKTESLKHSRKELAKYANTAYLNEAQ